MKHSKSTVINMYATDERSANQLEKVLPVVLGHESEEGQEGPAKRVKTGVAKVWVPPSLHAGVSFRALPINRESTIAVLASKSRSTRYGCCKCQKDTFLH